PACASFAVASTTTVLSIAENTALLCADGIDNNNNTLVDLADPACAAFATTTPVVVVSTGGGTVGSSFGSGPSFGGSSSGITSGTPVSTVITSTSTCNAMKTYIKKGRKNNVAEVTRLQTFLNQNLGLKISSTGFYGNKTFDAVRTFQLKYKDTILTPWGIGYSTGYFYKTTQRQMNMLLCPNVNFPMPVLN
ncbi:peptidoglycan-binding protein, partial [Arenimonas sp.]|nr:peptidoglycan-binding protein [Candidatus Parcubacteria bacterium]